MAIDSLHPEYQENIDSIKQCRDAYKGTKQVKAAGVTYLPATDGMIKDGMNEGQRGKKIYDAYRKRAVFPDYVEDAVLVAMGKLHQNPPVIELPESMESLREDATGSGVPLDIFYRQITEQQLIAGRAGLFADLEEVPNAQNVRANICLYFAESIINWDEGRMLDFVMLDETHREVGADLEWKIKEQYRMLRVMDGTYEQAQFDLEDGKDIDESKFITPTLFGNQLNKIPFVFINSKDLEPGVDKPPLLGLSDVALTIYRGEADYRQNLFMQGQDTLVVKTNKKDKEEGALRTGAGARITIEPEGDAKYIGVDSKGLAEQRQAIESDRTRAEHKSGQAITAKKGGVESAEALHIRVGSQSVTLTDVANTAAAGLEAMLKIVAEWSGANPELVKVTPNLDFTNEEMEGKTLLDLATANSIGAPISKQSIHRKMVQQDMTEMDFETEMQTIEEEKANP